MTPTVRTTTTFRLLPFALCLAMALSGCASSADDDAVATDAAARAEASAGDAVPDGTAMTCNADAAQGEIGQVATQDVVDRIVKATGSANARVIRPGMAVTMDFRQDRVNVEVDAKNAITGVKCG